jgi:hypothetical protein
VGSLVEITFYIGALYRDPAIMSLVGLNLISAVQHLYFMAAAPALFLPLGIILVRSRILTRAFVYLALALASVFAALGVIFLLRLTPAGRGYSFRRGSGALVACRGALMARSRKLSGILDTLRS